MEGLKPPRPPAPLSLPLIVGKTAKASHTLLPLGPDWVDSILLELIL